jgi:hypothetical protein
MFVGSLIGVAKWLILCILWEIDLQWDFHATPNPDLQPLLIETRGPMEEVEETVASEKPQRGGTVLEGESVARAPVYIDRGYGLPHY